MIFKDIQEGLINLVKDLMDKLDVYNFYKIIFYTIFIAEEKI